MMNNDRLGRALVPQKRYSTMTRVLILMRVLVLMAEERELDSGGN